MDSLIKRPVQIDATNPCQDSGRTDSFHKDRVVSLVTVLSLSLEPTPLKIVQADGQVSSYPEFLVHGPNYG